jgi:hypothetical protein
MIFCLGLLAVAQVRPAWSEDPDSNGSNGWTFSPTPYIWAVGLDGDGTVKGVETTIDASFIDIVQDSDSIFAYNGRFDAAKGNWRLQLVPTFARLGAKDDIDFKNINLNVDIDGTVTLAIVEFATMYKLGEWPNLASDPKSNSSFTLEARAGARYTYLKGELDLSGGPFGGRDFDQDKHWVDPFLGGVLTTRLTDRLSVVTGGDLGGFGVGSDFTWHAFGYVGYDFELFGRPAMVLAGYRALYQDYKDGSGRDEFKWDMTMHGPILGMSVRF